MPDITMCNHPNCQSSPVEGTDNIWPINSCEWFWPVNSKEETTND